MEVSILILGAFISILFNQFYTIENAKTVFICIVVGVITACVFEEQYSEEYIRNILFCYIGIVLGLFAGK